MDDKHFNPLADLTEREHEVLHMIVRKLMSRDPSQQTSDRNLSPDCEDCKVKPTSVSPSSKDNLND
jgi:hypothetical protein